MKKKNIIYEIYRINSELEYIQQILDVPAFDITDIYQEIALRDIRARLDNITGEFNELKEKI